MEWNKHAARAVLACVTEGEHYAHGVLSALGHPELGAAVKYRHRLLTNAQKQHRHALEAAGWNPESFADLMNQPDTPAINAARARAVKAAADLDAAWDQVELLRIDAQRWLESNCNYDGAAS